MLVDPSRCQKGGGPSQQDFDILTTPADSTDDILSMLWIKDRSC